MSGTIQGGVGGDIQGGVGGDDDVQGGVGGGHCYLSDTLAKR